MYGKLTHLRNQRGFTMAEVVMAALIFTASVVGISNMLISGGRNISQGAVQSTVMNLANRRLEEVKSLPFYIPWDNRNQDIDDFYYNKAKENGVEGDESKHPQLDNPAVVEDYGSIAGFPAYKRTTAIEYQYVVTAADGTTTHLAPAVMSTASPYTWVPSEPGDGQTDVPRGGANGSINTELHALVVEVCIFYNIGGRQQVYKERTLVGALTTAGAYNTPFLLIQSIEPTTGEWGSPHVDIKINVKATVPPFGPSATLDVRLWRTGEADIVGNSPVASPDGSHIDAWFDLSDTNKVKLGIPYNISVVWKNGGWSDVMRNCFKVEIMPPNITSIDNFNWAYAKQTARQVTIHGDHLDNLTSVILKGPNPTNDYQVNGTVVTAQSNATKIVVDFNLASTTTTADSRWNIMVTNAGGTTMSASDDQRLWVNPPPVITRVTPTNTGTSPSYFDWAHNGLTSRNVQVEGDYLYGFDQADTSATLKYGSFETAKATSADADPTVHDWDIHAPVMLTFNPNSAGAGLYGAPDTRWDVNLTNYGGTATSGDNGSRVWMNPPPIITSVSGATSDPNTRTDNPSGSPPYFSWAHGAQTARNVQINGQYLYALNQTDPTVQLEYNGYRTGKANFEASQNPSLYDVYSDTPVVMVFDTSRAWDQSSNLLNVKLASNTYWNVEITNYGGTVKSNGDATKQVLMNPTPNISGVATPSNLSTSPNYFDWAYLAQADRNVQVNGRYLYAMDQTADTQVSGKLRYLTTSPAETDETTTKAGFPSGQTNANLWAVTTSPVLTFHPNSAQKVPGGPPPPDTTYNKYWSVIVTNYGGTDNYGDSYGDVNKGVMMNPSPTVSSIQVKNTSTGNYEAFSTANSGTASDTNHKVGRVYTVKVLGTGLQAGARISLARDTFNPDTGTPFLPLTGGTVDPDGKYVTGLTMDVSVNPMTTASFVQWPPPSSTLATNANIAGTGTYHLIFMNPDTTDPNRKASGDTPQTQVAITHNSYAITATAKQSWGSVILSPTGTYYQDMTVTATASPTDTSSGQVQFVDWQSGGVDQHWSYQVTLTADAVHSIQARFRKKLYWGLDGVTNCNWASFVPGYDDDGGNTTFNATDPGDGTNMYLTATYKTVDNEIAGVTTDSVADLNNVSTSGATKVCIEWKQTGDAYSYLMVGRNKTSNMSDTTGYVSGKTYPPITSPLQTGLFPKKTSSIDVTGMAAGTYYVRVHTKSNKNANPAALRVYRIWLE